ncbi:ABC1 kinase family protein [Candidatus Nanohalobium constans]|uniref:Ubiquinone biosynthesis protein n=1 Tax=Candidatus Nanohalobium constans TaxID=2565781 RepID=A0A5Q0UGM8_9ARCH|nr:AarF/ABC1/UbiB kinase family protein [Candidatus Nanohalobium constans]QGA80778.1 ubiquinone biosynthesis protein [Candidatus Nanohalobium constans]
MRHPKQELQNLERFEEILQIIVRNGAGHLLTETKLIKHLPLSHRLKARRQSRPGPEALRETLEELGTTFIKFGQVLAERPDILPRKYTEELSKLQDHAPEFNNEKAHRIIEEEIGTEKFQNIEEEPIASASIAQVYKATLNSGEEVVIKVRRPEIKDKVETDLQIIDYLARKAEKHSKRLSDMHIHDFTKEFSNWTREEMDFKKEAVNAQTFRNNMEQMDGVTAPKTYPELNTEKVIVLEYIDGVKCTDEEKLDEWDIDAKEIAETAIEAGIKQSMRDGFFHADPHPSNFLITKEEKLVYLDFGMMGQIDQETRETLGIMLLYLIREDAEGMVECLEKIGRTTDDYDKESVKAAVNQKIMAVRNTTLEQNSITQEMFNLFVEISKHGIYMPSSLTLLGKNLVTVEGIGLTIYPDFKISDQYEDTIKEVLYDENSPEDIGEDLAIDLINNKDMISRLPSKINSYLENSNEQGKQEISIKKESTNLLPAVLILSSTLLITAGATIQPLLLYPGIAELLLGAYLTARN